MTRLGSLAWRRVSAAALVLAVAGCDGFLPEKVCPASGSRDRGWRSGFISSRLVKEVIALGGNITGLPGYNAAQVILADIGIITDWFPPLISDHLAAMS
jgi:hypothetical protein